MITSWPKIERGYHAVRSVIAEAKAEGLIGHDSEFITETLQGRIFGVASKTRCAACEWDNVFGVDVLTDVEEGKPLPYQISAYSCLGADRPVMEHMLSVKTPLTAWSDPMMRWYIMNSDLASVPKSTFTDDDAEGMGLGFMGLWACTSVLTDLPNWKRCIGSPTCQMSGRPCPEHNEMDYCAVDAWAGLMDDYSLREQMTPELEAYYSWRMEIAEYCINMQKTGVPINEEFIERLEAAFNAKKANLFPFEVVSSKEVSRKCKVCKGKKEVGKKNNKVPCGACGATGVELVTKTHKPKKVWVGPFNPNSSTAVVSWFNDHGIHLFDRGGNPSMGKEVVIKALTKQLKAYDLEFDPKEALLLGREDDDDPLPEHVDMLLRLAQKQNAGKGLKSWFDAQYVSHDGNVAMVHPRFNPCGSSMSRLSSSKPNFQNVPKAGFGAEVRKACIALPGCKVVKADLSQLEFRVCLWHAGVDPNAADGAFEMIVDASDGKLQHWADIAGRKPRDGAKSLVHAGDYMEGVSVRSKRDLEDARAIADRKAGALWVFDGTDLPMWMFRGRYVCFTGSNVAERFFGDRTRESRRKALALQASYMKVFPQIRDFQMEVSKKIEAKPAILSLPTGHFLRLYNRSDEDDLKQACALMGQGGGAIYAQEGMSQFRALARQAGLQVHDELVFFDIPQDWSDDKCAEFMMPMVQMSRWMKGFSCPAKVAIGPSWGETKEWGTIRL